MKLKTLQVQLHEQKSITKKLKIGRKNLEKENAMRSRYENPESKTIGTKKKKNWERTPRSNAAYTASRVRTLD